MREQFPSPSMGLSGSDIGLDWCLDFASEALG
jgi:hypothetical protein